MTRPSPRRRFAENAKGNSFLFQNAIAEPSTDANMRSSAETRFPRAGTAAQVFLRARKIVSAPRANAARSIARALPVQTVGLSSEEGGMGDFWVASNIRAATEKRRFRAVFGQVGSFDLGFPSLLRCGSMPMDSGRRTGPCSNNLWKNFGSILKKFRPEECANRLVNPGYAAVQPA